MAKVDEYRDQAAACLESAKKAVELKSKLELIGMAVAWLDLADIAERSATAALSVDPPWQDAGQGQISNWVGR